MSENKIRKQLQKNGKKVTDLYPMKVLKVDFIQVKDTPIELGFGLVVSYNKESKLLMGDFAQIVLLQRFTRDDTSTSGYKSPNFTDRFTPKDMETLSNYYNELIKQKKELFDKFKADTKAKYVEDKEERIRILKDSGYDLVEINEE